MLVLRLHAVSFRAYRNRLDCIEKGYDIVTQTCCLLFSNALAANPLCGSSAFKHSNDNV
jgi:hypothetical protein